MAVTDIFRDGILVDVNVSFWSAAKVLKAEDLGLKEEDVADAYKLGRKMLIPTEVIREFRSIEGKARRTVEENSFRFPIGNARFVPKLKFESIQAKLREFQDEYMGLVDKLVANYDQHRQQMIPIYQQAAEQAFINQTPETHTFGIDYDREKDKNDFISSFLSRIESYYPPAESLRKKFSLTWDIYEVALPRTDQSEAGTFRAHIQNKLNGFVEDVVLALRQETVEICGRVMQNLSDGKVIRGRTIQSLKDFIEKFASLNFVGDSEIEAKLKELRKEILDAHSTTDLNENKDLQGDLKEKLSGLSKMASNMTDISSITGLYHRKISWQEKEDG